MAKGDSQYYVDGVTGGDRRLLAKAITLIESSHKGHQRTAREMIDMILPYSGNSIRLGITGVPGVGKSTFIETLGLYLIEEGYRVAVLAVDPSSRRSKGSILGDKTRMQHLVSKEEAFVRPSPSGGTHGGVASKTRESILLCEAAGYNAVIVETVGVGQSETTVASMVDFFLVLMLAGAGDELQGIKKGIMEHADAIAINKADGENIVNAESARSEYERALHYFTPETSFWRPVVTTCSAIEGIGIDKLWETVLLHNKTFEKYGELTAKRKRQVLDWMWAMIDDEIKNRFYDNANTKKRLPFILSEVEDGDMSPGSALKALFKD